MIIDFKKTKIDLSDYSTTEEVQQMIDDSLSGVTVDLSDYWTSAQTETAINEATSEFVTSGDVETQIMEKNYTTSAETLTQINNSLSGYATETWVNSQGYLTQHQSLDNYYTSAQTDTKIAEAISEIDLSEIEGEISTLSGKVQTNEEVTAAALIELHNEISAITIPDVSEFVTSGQVQTQIDEAIGDIDFSSFVTSADTVVIENHLDDVERVASIAINDLNTRANSFVVGDGITTIKKISQADYDALVSGGTVDSNCFYAITGTTN